MDQDDERKGGAEPDESGPGTVRLEWPSLTLHYPDGSSDKRQLELGTTRVGRESEHNDIVIPETYSSVSRRHFELQRTESGWQLTNLGALNGVQLEGEFVEGSRGLEDGAEIRIGSAELDQQIRITFREGTLGEVLPSASEGGEAEPEAEVGRAAEPVEDGAYFEIRPLGAEPRKAPIAGERVILGRGEGSDVRLQEPYVSARHAEIVRGEDTYRIADLDSTNGTWLNGDRLTPRQPAVLGDGAVVRIGDERLGASIGLTFHNPVEREGVPSGYAAGQLRELGREAVLLGRESDADIQLASPTVSRRHAVMEWVDGQHVLHDLGSLNGTYVNGERIERRQLQDGDLISIQGHLLRFQGGELRQFESQGVRLDARNLIQRVQGQDGTRTILDDISLTVLPREFVALVGASGSGKSTLMNALMGVWPAQEGSVLVNGRDLYAQYEAFRAQIGYVPQADILHTSLTVERALDFAARLRLPPDTEKDERRAHIDRVLQTVDMADPAVRATTVGRLSGGQRKRVSIAAELLADPRLFFLDEATSGLDPGLEKKFMHTLRGMADEGRTVVLITHATANIVQVDQVAFLAQGHLVYFGTPTEALSYFEVPDFADIYEQVHEQGEKWERAYREDRSGLHSRYVAGRQQQPPTPIAGEGFQEPPSGLREIGRQLGVMTERTLRVLSSDRLTLLLLLLLFPLTAVLQLVISTPNVLTGDLAIMADPVAAAATMTESYRPLGDLNIFVFVMGLEAVLVGMYVPSNELINERAIYLRERMVNLGVTPYLLSKVFVFTLFAAVQCVLYLAVLSLGVEFPERGLLMPFAPEVFITLFLTMLAGIGLGLLVSALSRSSDMAIYMLVILMFFEFFFAGTVFDLRGNRAEPLSYLTATRWSLLALGVSIDMPAQAESTVLCNEAPAGQGTVCRHFPEATEELMLPYRDGDLVRSWAYLLAMTGLSVLVSGVLIRRLDPI